MTLFAYKASATIQHLCVSPQEPAGRKVGGEQHEQDTCGADGSHEPLSTACDASAYCSSSLARRHFLPWLRRTLALFGLRHTMQRSAFGTFSDMQLTPFGGISSEYSSEASATTMISMC